MTFKQLASPISTSGAGFQLEAHYSAMFLVLMLTDGRPPVLPPWPIVEIKLQGKVDGWETDDLVVTVQHPRTGQRNRLLGQVRRTVAVTKSNEPFAEALYFAWHDYNNAKVFTRGQDAIALMTGLLSAVDGQTVPWLLEHARATTSPEEYLRNVETVNFSPPSAAAKLEVIQNHLRYANNDVALTPHELYDFLRHFYLFSSDLGGESGIDVSLLHSHILQFDQKPEWVWARAVEVVRNFAKTGGTITRENVPDDLIAAFDSGRLVRVPIHVDSTPDALPAHWGRHSVLLAMLVLIGRWTESNEHDYQRVASVTERQKAHLADDLKAIVHVVDSPLVVRGGVSHISNREHLVEQLGA